MSEDIRLIQFSMLVLMVLLTLTLVIVKPGKATISSAVKRTRRLMIASNAILAIQFALQFILGLRMTSTTQAVALNLLMFIPTTWLLSLSMLLLQHRGKLKRGDYLTGALSWLLVLVLISVSATVAGEPYFHESKILSNCCFAGCVIYALMQLYYSFRLIGELRSISRSLLNYYDNDMSHLLHWMGRSIAFLASMGILVPLLLFSNGIFLIILGLAIIGSIYSLEIGFICYTISNNYSLVAESQNYDDALPEKHDNENKTASTITAGRLKQVEEAVNQWCERGGHLKGGITIQSAAEEIGIPHYLFSAWLKTTEQKLFSPWLTYLRIEHAKRLICEHPDWSNDAIARQCGFNTRNYFQTIFRRQTGMTPLQYSRKMQS